MPYGYSSMNMSQKNIVTPGTEKVSIEKPFVRCFPGDILVTNSDGLNSAGIRLLTCSPVSHAVLMMDHENAIEAIPDGVKSTKLIDVIRGSNEVIVLRHKQISYVQGLGVARYVKSQVGKGYDFIGAARSGFNSGRYGVFKYNPIGMAVQLADSNLNIISGHEVTFFCSELVTKAYESVGLKLSSKRPWVTVPGGLLKSDQLEVMTVFKKC